MSKRSGCWSAYYFYQFTVAMLVNAHIGQSFNLGTKGLATSWPAFKTLCTRTGWQSWNLFKEADCWVTSLCTLVQGLAACQPTFLPIYCCYACKCACCPVLESWLKGWLFFGQPIHLIVKDCLLFSVLFVPIYCCYACKYAYWSVLKDWLLVGQPLPLKFRVWLLFSLLFLPIYCCYACKYVCWQVFVSW